MISLGALLIPMSAILVFAAFMFPWGLIEYPTAFDIFVIVMAGITFGPGVWASWFCIVSLPYMLAKDFVGQIIWNSVRLRKRLIKWHFLAEGHGHGKPTAEDKKKGKNLFLMLWTLTIAPWPMIPAAALAATVYYRAQHGLEVGMWWYVAIAAAIVLGLVVGWLYDRRQNVQAHEAHHGPGDHGHHGPAHHGPGAHIVREPFRGTPMTFNKPSNASAEGGKKKGGGKGGGKPTRARGGHRAST